MVHCQKFTLYYFIFVKLLQIQLKKCYQYVFMEQANKVPKKVNAILFELNAFL